MQDLNFIKNKIKMKNIGLIFCGYPGVGKTSIAGSKLFMDNGQWMPVIDLEISLMKTNCENQDNWQDIYVKYVNYVQDLTNQGFNVMCSIHALVRQELERRNLLYINVMPALNIKDYWLIKLRERWKKSCSDKDFFAYERAMEYYDDDIKELMKNDAYCIIGTECDYELNEVLCNYIRYNKHKYTYN